jgi:4-hydroxy-3-methylbut-2-enyl diphosphate reductase IspH
MPPKRPVFVSGLTGAFLTASPEHAKPYMVAPSREHGTRVHDADGLRLEWFAGRERVGLAAGTSTLYRTLDAIESRLMDLRVSATSDR